MMGIIRKVLSWKYMQKSGKLQNNPNQLHMSNPRLPIHTRVNEYTFSLVE